ncbi:MAG: hypothetical protein WB492_05480, partial [Christiangramia sp.]
MTYFCHFGEAKRLRNLLLIQKSKEISPFGRDDLKSINFYLYNMSQEPFKFKQFSVDQDRCAMKIGTDGV